jgi:hypothetical protein
MVGSSESDRSIDHRDGRLETGRNFQQHLVAYFHETKRYTSCHRLPDEDLHRGISILGG